MGSAKKRLQCALSVLLMLSVTACASLGARESAEERWPANLVGEWMVLETEAPGDSAIWRLSADGRLRVADVTGGSARSSGRWWTEPEAGERRLCYTFRPGRYFICGDYSFPERQNQLVEPREFRFTATTSPFQMYFRERASERRELQN